VFIFRYASNHAWKSSSTTPYAKHATTEHAAADVHATQSNGRADSSLCYSTTHGYA